jgi:hypothetical protein
LKVLSSITRYCHILLGITPTEETKTAIQIVLLINFFNLVSCHVISLSIVKYLLGIMKVSPSTIKYHYCSIYLWDVARFCQVWSAIVRFCQVSSGFVRYCLVLSGIVGYCQVLSGIVGYCRVLSGIVSYQEGLKKILTIQSLMVISQYFAVLVSYHYYQVSYHIVSS